MKTYKKKDVLAILKKEDFVKSVKEFADKELSHLFILDEKAIAQVLTAISWYCEQRGVKATKRIYEHTLLQMVQYEEGACGHRFELWAM